MKNYIVKQEKRRRENCTVDKTRKNWRYMEEIGMTDVLITTVNTEAQGY